MKRILVFLVVHQIFCTQSILAQFLPYANGYPLQALLANPNQILNLRQPAPVYNYIQNQPNLPVVNRQATVPVNQLLGLPVLNGVPVLYNTPIANNLPIRNSVPALPINNQNYRNAPLVNQLSSYPYGNVPIVNQLNPLNSLPINAVPFAAAPVVNQVNSLPLVNPFAGVPINSLQLGNVPVNRLPANTVPFANVPSGNPLANALVNILYNGLVLPNKSPVTAPIYNNLPLPGNNLQLINPYQILPTPTATYLPNTAPNVISSLPIVNSLSNNINRNPLNVLPVNGVSVPIVNTLANNVNRNPLNVLPLNGVLVNQPVLNSAPIIGSPTKSNRGFTLLLDNDISEPVVSLNGLQLGGLGTLPLFNGLPVIGMKESVINLSAV